jgi:hypothetical protein
MSFFSLPLSLLPLVGCPSWRSEGQLGQVNNAAIQVNVIALHQLYGEVVNNNDDNIVKKNASIAAIVESLPSMDFFLEATPSLGPCIQTNFYNICNIICVLNLH